MERRTLIEASRFASGFTVAGIVAFVIAAVPAFSPNPAWRTATLVIVILLNLVGSASYFTLAVWLRRTGP